MATRLCLFTGFSEIQESWPQFLFFSWILGFPSDKSLFKKIFCSNIYLNTFLICLSPCIVMLWSCQFIMSIVHLPKMSVSWKTFTCKYSITLQALGTFSVVIENKVLPCFEWCFEEKKFKTTWTVLNT